MTHTFPLRVYYEDTDLGGIVYYANYLKFIERARSEWVREAGVDQRKLMEEDGVGFVVRRVEADYLRPAHFDDALVVRTQLVETGNSKFVLQQDVLRGDIVLFEARVTCVAINRAGRPVRIPEVLRDSATPR